MSYTYCSLKVVASYQAGVDANEMVAEKTTYSDPHCTLHLLDIQNRFQDVLKLISDVQKTGYAVWANILKSFRYTVFAGSLPRINDLRKVDYCTRDL